MYKTQYTRDYYKRNPWAVTMSGIYRRCGKDGVYSKKGIRNYLTMADMKKIWFRDKAYLMKKPTIHRLDNTKGYTMENCRYIEHSEHIKIPIRRNPHKGKSHPNARAVKQIDKDGKVVGYYFTQSEAADGTQELISLCCYEKQKHHRGYKWAFIL